MQARWPWLQRTDPSWPWSEFDIDVPTGFRQLFQAAARWKIGDGRGTKFWEDRWLDGFRVQELALTIYDRVQPSTKSERTVAQALTNSAWASDVGPELLAQALHEYMILCDRLAHTHLNHEAMDSVIWAWEKSGEYSDGAYVEANRAFLRREQAESDALFAEIDAEIETEEAGAEKPELQLPPMLPEPGTKIIVISNE
ncbi:uncharacterized protein [Aegilops tauschii subsp. strangulata]|uniref:uncharacterized protein n=1 Tax=Aegilops tauschii subsp. strangulata TaxID=200361 RepID=UPI003CC8B77D